MTTLFWRQSLAPRLGAALDLAKSMQDVVAGGGEGLRILKLDEAVPLEGGIPLVRDGKIIGAIGASGSAGKTDSQVAQAGADSIK